MSTRAPGRKPSPANDWPRDFDVRERYAEQQELLGEARAPAAPRPSGRAH
ncbi:hypothetical protein SAMN05216577_11730 [Pseudomonas citronellolis]|uniref:Uncharacterized protein n=1 Tax=Pseudomonas citronellolis TaxID=53408 RepID=A0AAQ1KGB8_9PSED|nr:hypothetical protein [Pseudomonas citronellolis]SFD11850.1 hypothetical protein SAMN05216577_11730 [Pseudomonas citronellolis]